MPSTPCSLAATTRFLRFSLVISASVAIACSFAVPTLAADTDFHYLAADPSLRAQMTNVNVTMGQATHVGKVLQRDQDWESPYNILYTGSTLIDPSSGQWRMYYEMMVPGQEFQRGVAMATSPDGVTWTKPALNVTGTTYTTSTSNNFVNLPTTWMGGPSVFVDPSAPANQRYRMSATVDETTLQAMTSADGVNWTSAGIVDDRGSNAALDSLNVTLRDSNTQNYKEFGRWWYGGGYLAGRRGVYMKESSTWDGVWNDTRQFIIDPADHIPNGSTNYFDIYTPGIQTYHGQYIGMPSMYYHPGDWSVSGALYPSFMYSRDGLDWTIPDAYHSMIDLSAHGHVESDVNQTSYTATSMVEHDGQLYIYYSYFPENHNDGGERSAEIHLATLPQDRFMGIESTPGNVGTWTTSAITLSDDPGHLVLNAMVDGSLSVEVLDASTMTPITGFALIDATPIASGDFLNTVAQWGSVNELNALAGQTIAFRFTMDDSTVYGFHFEPTPEPSTIVLLTFAAICLFAYRSRKR